MDKLHGKVKIELYNANTQIKEVIKGENVFQNAVIAKGLRNLGSLNSSYLTNNNTRSYPYWQAMVGGLFLFRDSIQEGSEYMPAGNKMTGNGSYGITNNANPNELGSYNSVESSASMGTITQVYDFTTQQANGTIGCVSLTSKHGGYIGYGNASGKANATARNIRQDLDLMNTNPIETGDSYQRAVIGNTYFRFDYNSSTHIITVRKWPVAITQASVFSNMPMTPVDIDVSSYMSTVFTSNGIRVLGVTNGKVILANSVDYEIPVGSSFYYLEYNPSDDSVTQKTVVNTSVNSVFYCGGAGIVKDRAIFKVTANLYNDLCAISIFDLTNNSHIGEFVTKENYYSLDTYNSPAEWPNGLIQLAGGGSSSPFECPYGCMVIYDPINETIYPTNGVLSGDYRYTGYYYDADTDTIGFTQRWNAYRQINPLYLATIYNLQSPVTKTVAQTMKVTYTLTEA